MEDKNLTGYNNIKYFSEGYGMTLLLSQFDSDEKYRGYAASCRYKYIKNKDKYSLSMWLKHKTIDSLFRIEYEGIDTQYIPGDRDTIRDNICRIVQQMMETKQFDLYIERFEYDMMCWEKGIELIEAEKESA